MLQFWKARRTLDLYRALGPVAPVCRPAWGMRFTCPQIWWWKGWFANVSRDDAPNKQKGEEQAGQPNKLFFRGSACKFIWLHDENVSNINKISLSLFRTQCMLCQLSSQATWRRANAATGLLRNSDADVVTYFCCLHVRIIRRFFAIAAYISSRIFVRNIYCPAYYKRLLICTVLVKHSSSASPNVCSFCQQTTEKAHLWKQTKPYDETKTRKWCEQFWFRTFQLPTIDVTFDHLFPSANCATLIYFPKTYQTNHTKNAICTMTHQVSTDALGLTLPVLLP